MNAPFASALLYSRLDHRLRNIGLSGNFRCHTVLFAFCTQVFQTCKINGVLLNFVSVERVSLDICSINVHHLNWVLKEVDDQSTNKTVTSLGLIQLSQLSHQ